MDYSVFGRVNLSSKRLMGSKDLLLQIIGLSLTSAGLLFLILFPEDPPEVSGLCLILVVSGACVNMYCLYHRRLSVTPPRSGYMNNVYPSLPPCSHWRKIKWIGSGSSGHVYLVSNGERGQLRVVKEILDPHSKEQINQLNLEIEFLSKLSHPNIVQYYGSNMESMIRSCTAQILCGLAYLHWKEIVHRDIKGANILVGPNGEVKLADFGLAKHISSVAEIHSDKGTSFWKAPEVILSKFSGNGYNLLADIWSLGCTVIEMATGEHPWHEHCITGQSCNTFQVAGMFKAAFSNDTPKIPENLSEEGKDFLQQCLQRDPSYRPTATQLKDHPFVRDYFV